MINFPDHLSNSIPHLTFCIRGTFFAAGALAYVGAGVVGVYGAAVSMNLAMVVIYGRGAMIFLGAGHMDIVGKSFHKIPLVLTKRNENLYTSS